MVEVWSKCGRSSFVSGPALFDTVPKEDPLALFHDGYTNYERVVKLLDFKKRDVAQASRVSLQSIRYDQKMPKELEERIREWAIALSLVGQYFRDEHKTVLWFRTSNPLLGNITPRDLIKVGRFKKLYRFILNAISENEPPTKP
jgi:hypothetical protein